MHILAPLAVRQNIKKKGVGGLLIQEGVRRLQGMGSNLVFVLGHKEYYPKYGFKPHAGKLGYTAPYPVPEVFGACWMVQAISKEGFDIGKGKITCAEMLGKPEHWRNDDADKI